MISTDLLVWHTVTPLHHPHHLVKGTVLSVALCGPSKRFAIYEIRTKDRDGYPDRYYEMRTTGASNDNRRTVVNRTESYREIVDYLSVLKIAVSE